MPCWRRRKNVKITPVRCARRIAVVFRLVRSVSLCAGAALLLAGCGGSAKEALGLGKRAPDEFAVFTRAPLTVPPDYGLRPPQPGAEPSAIMPRDDARATVFGYAAGRASAAPGAGNPRPGASAGTRSILDRSGATGADPAIRTLINRETTILAEKDRTFTERLMFWSTPTEYGTVVDPVEEARRINENQALGRSVTAGTTPTIERRRRALLEGIFN